MCKETYYSDVLPYYLSLGLKRDEIDSSCPTELKPYDDAMNLKIMRQDMMNWYNGLYTLNAMVVAIDKAFNAKSSTIEYIDEPLMADINLTEEEREKKRYDKELKKALAYEAKWAAQAQHLPKNI